MNFRSIIARIARTKKGGESVVTPDGRHRPGRIRLNAVRAAAVAGLAAVVVTVITVGKLLSPASAPASPFGESYASAAAYGGPQLHVSGNKLVDASGATVVLHGVDRSGTEFMCVQNRGIFDGPSSVASIRTMKHYGINAVRIPLNEACWNGESYVKPGYAGTHYQAAVKAYVKRLNANDIVAILDLHWTDGQYSGGAGGCGSAQATCQKPMPDAAGSIPFWKSVASTFKGNDAVIFDLFNEPYPEQAGRYNQAEGWRCWLRGGQDCVGISYPVAGMQTLVDAVRSTGASNVLMLSGLEWSNDLTQWLSHEPVDPDHNLAASWHSYNFNGCSTKACWNRQIAPVLAKVPVIAGEIGENDCAGSYVDRLTSWMDSKSASYLAWTWNSDFNCATGPGLITSYTGQPTGFGAAYEAHLQSLRTGPAIAASKAG